MAVTVEDGTIVAGANSYNSRADGDAYFGDRPSSTWASSATTAQKDEALVSTGYWVDQQGPWIGVISSEDDDRMEWPRLEAYREGGKDYSGIIPENLKRAQLEAAEAYLNGQLEFAIERGGAVSREKLGPIEVEYQAGAPGTYTFPFITALLKPLRRGGGMRRAW